MRDLPVRCAPLRFASPMTSVVQLDAIAQLNDHSAIEEIRLALEQWTERSKSDPRVLERAKMVRVEIGREAETKHNAISAIFAGNANRPNAAHPARSTNTEKSPQD